MAVIYNTPKSIIYDNLVFHIDPPNKNCIAEGGRTDPLTNSGVNGVKDLTGNLERNGNTISRNDSSDSPSGDGYKPQWHTDSSPDTLGDSMGYIRYHSNGAGTTDYYYYGYLDLGTPVNGVTKFGETDCYTVDFWWRQDTTTSNYVYQGGHLLGHRDVITAWPSYGNRKYVWGSYDVGIFGTAGTNYNLRWSAGQEDFANNNTKLYECVANSIYTFGTWHHHCCVFDLGDSLGGGSKVYSYLDGTIGTGVIATNDATIVGSGSWYNNTTNGGNIYIGGSNRQGLGQVVNDGRSNGADGGMGPFKIYNRALNASEVKQNYDALKWRYK